MAIYTYESNYSIPRITDKFVVIDTSYFIALNTHDPNYRFKSVVSSFHRNLQQNTDTSFYINIIVREECIRQYRKGRIARCIQKNLLQTPTLEATYRRLFPQQSSLSITDLVSKRFDAIYKYHVKQGDIDTILNLETGDYWAEQNQAEALLDLEYFPGSSQPLWDAFGRLFNDTLMDPTDCLIANAAIYHECDAIFTTDCDFAQVSDRIDVYMPRSVATQCRGRYDWQKDNS